MEWKRTLARLILGAEAIVDGAKLAVGEAINGERAIRVQAYAGYGTPERAYVNGRVLFGARIGPAREDDAWWVNLLNTYRRLESDEVPGARVRISFGGTEVDATADGEGFFQAWVSPCAPIDAELAWHEADVQLLRPRRAAAVRDRARILIPPASARFGIISDLDDTVLQSRVGDLIGALRAVLFGNARTRLPFPGVAAFYRALEAGVGGAEGNPIFYVSSSPWNLYDLLVEFLEVRGIPAGPLTLRDWGLTANGLLPTQHARHKLGAIRRILATYPALPFILIGDSSQEDPEIYRGVVHEHPGRILAVYIRNVSTLRERLSAIEALGAELAAAGSALLLADDTLAAARHAAERGWIRADALGAVAEERGREEREPAAGPAPTLIVDGRTGPAR